MNVQKLFKAASMIAQTQPQLSKELTKIAQELTETTTDTLTAPTATQADPLAGVNPEIKNFATPSTQEAEKVIHKITLTLEAPKDLGELDVMNEVLPVINQIKGQKGIALKGYQFTQS